MPVHSLIAAIDSPDNDSRYALASTVNRGIPIYDCTALVDHLEPGTTHEQLKAELAANLLNGAGAFVLKGAFPDTSVIDEATDVFKNIIAGEKIKPGGGADHFATAGANDRIWNSLEKLCAEAPDVFTRYHANRWIEFASNAWLGPNFQMTAQVNLVRPGGKAQEAHCDYHLGFMTSEQAAMYPPHVHALSPQLTLQGAIAHCDMPIEAGTTKLLPYSQNWQQNYINFRDPEVRALFEERHIQLPLEKGDLLFFSPGLLHGAGDNITNDVERMANLIQVSSAFGVAMETINRTQMCKLVYPVLLQIDLSAGEKQAAIASTGHGYSFPTSLDSDPPVGGLAPQSQQALMLEALEAGWNPEKFNKALDAREAKRWS